jgi:hypothetical protein
VITRTDWVDWYVAEEESAVMVDGNVVVLSALATVLVECVGEGATLQTLEAALVDAFGSPDDGDVSAATQGAVTALVDAGVLAVRDRD